LPTNQGAEATQQYRPGLPSSARTRLGTTFDPSADIWAFRDGIQTIHVNFALAFALNPELLHSLRVALLWYAEHASAWHLKNMYSRSLHLIRFLARAGRAPISEISGADLLNYRSSLGESRAYYLGSLAGFLKKWHRLGLPGVSAEAVSLLDEMRIKGNEKGAAVLSMDPVEGPFTSIELESIQSAVDEAYARGSVTEDQYLLTWLFMALGQRPAQYAALKVCDVFRNVSEDGAVSYSLRVPRVKQRHGDPRAEFKDRPLISQIGEQLYEYAQRVQRDLDHILEDPTQAPLFPASHPDCWGEGLYAGHRTSAELSSSLILALEKLDVRSERTGTRLHISPIRFRRTFGTRAAQEGHRELVIAELLDHDDTQNVGVYVSAVPEIAARIDRAVAMQLAPLAQAFQGVVIKDESQATRGKDPTSRIIDLRIDRAAKPFGSCGQHRRCKFNAPISCYTCRSFEPWRDGPHEAVLTHLLEERERLVAARDARVAAVNDRAILAVAQVIQLCGSAEGEGERADD
jgi:integrase